MQLKLLDLRVQVCEANVQLQKSGLVRHTWGNVSGLDYDTGMMVIKPSGVEYNKLTPDNMVILDLDGQIVEGSLTPSTDAPTHIELYKAIPELGGIAHTHSLWATAWAQAGIGIPAYGTTHADCFWGEIPCTREMTQDEVKTEYEKNSGKVIVEHIQKMDIDKLNAILLKNHGPFTWGKTPKEAELNSEYLEEIAQLAWMTRTIRKDVPIMPYILLSKHYSRKHGAEAYYGQDGK